MNIITVIKGCSELFLNGAADTKAQRLEFAQIIEESAKRLVKVVGELKGRARD